VKVLKNTIALASFVGLILPAVISRQVSNPAFLQPSRVLQMDPPDSLRKDSLLFPFEDLKPYQLPSSYTPPLYLANPKNYKDSVVYDPVRDEYTIYQKIGSLNYRQPITLSSKEYLEYDFEKSLQAYWREQTAGAKHNKDISSLFSINLPFLKEESPFGSNTIDIRPSGSAELIFGVNSNRRDDPALSVKQRRTTNFDFQEKIQMNVQAKIGDKIDFGIKWNTEANFDFENKVKLKYEGKEDEIIKLIEAGDVSLPLNSTLISGSQALFGIKTKLQFGKLTMTNVFSQQKSQTNNITITGGAQVNKFELYADEYEEKKHFLLAQYFRKNYSKWLKTLPIVSSPIKITKIEVWVTNIGPVTQENRNIVAFMDLGEVEPYNHILTPTPGGYLPSNKSNNLLTYIDPNQIRDVNHVSSYLQNAGFIGGVDYEKIENARLLSPTEYTVNTQLGFISLNTKLNDDHA
jgi:cell surface protein SprA